MRDTAAGDEKQKETHEDEEIQGGRDAEIGRRGKDWGDRDRERLRQRDRPRRRGVVSIGDRKIQRWGRSKVQEGGDHEAEQMGNGPTEMGAERESQR